MQKTQINEVLMLKNKKTDDKYDLTVVCPKYSLEKKNIEVITASTLVFVDG